jgi:hypothetical protein
MKLHVYNIIHLLLSITLTSAFQASSPFSKCLSASARTGSANAFSSPRTASDRSTSSPIRERNARPKTFLRDTLTSQVEEIMKQEYPLFHKYILSANPTVWKEFSESSSLGFTVFSVSDDVMRGLGEQKLSQLEDIRNGETVEKIAAYHAVNEPVGAEELFNSGGVVTIGGVVDVGRSRTGGFMGIGGQEDGGVLVNGAKMIQTLEVEKALIHEMDALISPEILWRYVDQLRIPGSK